jgi:hypothetical protein
MNSNLSPLGRTACGSRQSPAGQAACDKEGGPGSSYGTVNQSTNPECVVQGSTDLMEACCGLWNGEQQGASRSKVSCV